MARVLITAFEPYDNWAENASWLAMVELTKNLPGKPHVTTRRYPVDFLRVRELLEKDLADEYDFAIHLGQAPGTSRIYLEAIGINVGGHSQQMPEDFQPLVAGGPVAYHSSLPLADWSVKLQTAGIPARVSYHAGTYLCNATLYLSHHIAEQRGLPTRSTFVHLPLDVSQAAAERIEHGSLPAALSAAAIRLILEELESE